ncbi:OB-fold nucleic acid binding domain-containing protein [Serinibacter salmoneus]|uniref:ATP-dependent DNA helicase RecG n=1 Tax=Serinibacter salmoneus TaxID=556530 RepID=A0A2A9CYM6_9MICO|nr:OB-fold nucleic acid binding domain-containing protein [Serinibacter salmoneus]PFG19548.1 ATP-dependent DNA helicase RecG [Serinibacter salmoneus]
MGAPPGATERTRGFLASHEELRAADLRRWVAGLGVRTIAAIQPRERVEVAGTVRSVTYAPSGSIEPLRAELYDGTGSVELRWTGRHEVHGICPGRRLIASGMVAAPEPTASRCVLNNPRYTLLPGEHEQTGEIRR